MSDEEKAEYDAKVLAEVDASGGKLKKRRKRRKDAKTFEQVKACLLYTSDAADE